MRNLIQGIFKPNSKNQTIDFSNKGIPVRINISKNATVDYSLSKTTADMFGIISYDIHTSDYTLNICMDKNPAKGITRNEYLEYALNDHKRVVKNLESGIIYEKNGMYGFYKVFEANGKFVELSLKNTDNYKSLNQIEKLINQIK